MGLAQRLNALPADQKIKILKGVVIGQSIYYTGLILIMQQVIQSNSKEYRKLVQQYEILAKYANWEDPMIKTEMQTLKEFRDIVEPPKDDDNK